MSSQCSLSPNKASWCHHMLYCHHLLHHITMKMMIHCGIIVFYCVIQCQIMISWCPVTASKFHLVSQSSLLNHYTIVYQYNILLNHHTAELWHQNITLFTHNGCCDNKILNFASRCSIVPLELHCFITIVYCVIMVLNYDIRTPRCIMTIVRCNITMVCFNMRRYVALS